MSKEPFISVITPTYNSERTLAETLESVAIQMDDSIEHIVMDGGSTDGTIEILQKFPHVQWFSERDEGHYHAMHKGVLASRGRFFNVLNSDDCFRLGAIKAVKAALQSHADWDGLFGDIVFVDGSGHEIYRREEACFDYNVLRFALGYVIHPTFFLSKEMYLQLRGFDYQRLKNCADFELMLKAGRVGARIGHVPELLIDYRFHDHGQSADMRIQRNMAREAAIIMREHGRLPGLAGSVQAAYYKAKRQGQKLILRGKFDLLPGNFKLRRFMREKCDFSSNIGLDKLPE
jgi:glycosyltransferase involved in cell wall biosynthesis